MIQRPPSVQKFMDNPTAPLPTEHAAKMLKGYVLLLEQANARMQQGFSLLLLQIEQMQAELASQYGVKP